MGSIRAVFDAILDAAEDVDDIRKVQLEIPNRNEYETARTRLVKFWSDHKQAIAAIGGEETDPYYQFSMCGNYNPSTRIATFYLGLPRRKTAKTYSFSIVDSATESRTSDTAGEQQEQ